MGLILPNAAWARDDDGVQRLDPITVSGDKLGRTVSESAASVAVATEEDLASSSDRTMHEIVSRYANVVRLGSDHEIAIRGIPQSGIAGEGETISVYLDGVALTSRAAQFAGPMGTFDLQRVEVVRGPQSTSQGRNSLAGAVFMESEDPASYWDAHAKVADISHDSHQYAFAGGGPLVGDQLMFRVAFNDYYDRGDIRNVTLDRGDAGRKDLRTERLKLILAPDAWPGYRAELSVTHGDNEFGDTLFDVTYGERTASANVRYNETYEADIYSLKQTLLLGRHYDLTAITGWIDGDGFRTADFDRTEADGGFSVFDQLEERFSQELRLNFDYDRLRGVFGLYYEDTDDGLVNDGQGVPAAGGLAVLSGVVDAGDNIETIAPFTEMDWDFAENWRLTLGLRWNHERTRNRARADFDVALQVPTDSPRLPADLRALLPPGILPPYTLPDGIADILADQGFVPSDYDVREKEDFSVLLPKIGLTWSFLDPHSISLTYQEGYRSGGTSVSFFGGDVSIFDPEETRTVELALRTRWLRDSLRANVNVFYTDWEDQQVQIGDSTSFYTITTNAGSSHFLGAETELVWGFAPSLETFASLGVLDTEFDEFVNQGEDYAGNEFPYAPDYTATVGIALLPWHGWEGQVAVQRVEEFYSDPSNTDDRLVPARTLVNARVAYECLPNLKLFAFGRNLTDDDNIQGQLTSDGRTARRYGEPRTIGVGLEWQPGAG